MKTSNSLVAYCGLYCGACNKYQKKKCPGCRENEKATWCKIRVCCQEKQIQTCAECDMNVKDCKIYSNFMSKIFAILFKSDRNACIQRIKEIGIEEYAEEMNQKGCQTIKRK